MDFGRRAATVAGMTALIAAAGPMATAAERKPDLRDVAAGTYAGEVISDSEGSSKSDVTLTLTRTDP
jgi:hypothetical protein